MTDPTIELYIIMIRNEPTPALSSARSLFNTSYAKNIVVCTMCCVESKLF